VDSGVWRTVYEDAFPRIYRALIAMGARPEEAEDALHDAFERALRSGAKVDRPDGWLFVTAVRRWRRARIRSRIFRPLELFSGSADPPGDDRLTLLREMKRLSHRQREVLVARYVLGFSQEETAELLGIARGTVAATTTQAARLLRHRMGEQ
jgi:DNA-directed RNA polymerase specialized sigma24 family protein